MTPSVNVTMLGDSGSGKTTFMVGMIGALLAGDPRTGYAVHPEKRDDGLDLVESWHLLRRNGTFPDATPSGGYKKYQFTMSRTLGERIVTINWLDYRGAAITEGPENEDTAGLIQTLAESDSIYLALDGGVIGKWVADVKTGALETETSLQDVQGDLGILHLSLLLYSAVSARHAAKRPGVPSIVVLLTKADRLRVALEPLAMSWDEGFALTQNAVQTIFDLAFRDPQAKTMINPTTVGFFPQGGAGHRTATSGFRPPFLFTYLCHLEDAIAAEEPLLGSARHAKERVDAELTRVSAKPWILRWGRARLVAEQARLTEEITHRRTRLQTLRAEADTLRRELRDTAIYDGGKPRTTRQHG
jgi:hypothetical protein